MDLPRWEELVIGAAALVGAVGVLWLKVVRPIIRIGAKSDEHEDRLDDHEKRLGDLEDDR